MTGPDRIRRPIFLPSTGRTGDLRRGKTVAKEEEWMLQHRDLPLKRLGNARVLVEPPWGVEPQTYALRVRCSTN